MDTKVAAYENDDVMLPGFRFHPTDEELVGYYLKRKVQRLPLPLELIKQLDIYKFDPWDLPKLASYGDREWYFYCPRGRKYRNSTRPNRVAVAGYWKATGIDKPIYSSNPTQFIGLKKSLVFYTGRAATGRKTDWMMHEFRLPSHRSADKTPSLTDSWAICKIFKKTRTQQSFSLSKTTQFSSSVGGLSDSFTFAPMEAPQASECTVDTASMVSNQFLMDPSEDIMDSQWRQSVREILEVEEDGEGLMKNSEGVVVENQWESVSSMGFPVTLQGNDAWKLSFPFDLAKFC